MSGSRDGLGRFVRTARRLSARQIFSRLRHMRRRASYARDVRAPLRAARLRAAGATPRLGPRVDPDVLLPGDDARDLRAVAYAAGEFEFLGRSADFEDSGVPWEHLPYTPLWRYQMQYLQPVLDLVLEGRSDDARALLDSWRESFEETWHVEAWHPYPASLRLANLCHAVAAAGSYETLGTGVAELLATHVSFVLTHLETDVRGNHLLENARALLIASRFFDGPLAESAAVAAREILLVEIPEQVLDDGAHFELSPMYHCIVLQRLIELAHVVGIDHELARELLVPAVRRMSLFLERILCPDGGIPLFGDAARGFGPDPGALLAESALVVGTTGPAEPGGSRTSGLQVLRTLAFVVYFDCGPVCPPYLPAHAQADSLSLEVWVRGVCVVADPGLHEYTGDERAWGRSTRAHSTVTLDGRDSSEVYGSFRAGGLARVVAEEPGRATLRPWNDDAYVTREVAFDADDTLVVSDRVDAAPGRVVESRLHLHEDVRVESCEDGQARLATPAGLVVVTSDAPLRTEPSRRSPCFGVIQHTTALVVTLPFANGLYAATVTLRAVGS